MQERDIQEKDLIQKVEEAAYKGAFDGAKKSGGGLFRNYLKILLMGIVIIAFLFLAKGFINPFGFFSEREKPVEDHDMTLENNGFFGYVVADFSEAILGDSKHLSKLEVYSRDISELTTVTEAGLMKLSVFTKNQFITYHGKAIYTIDLSQLRNSDIKMDEKNFLITINIPRPALEPINIPSDNIEFGDVNKGILALGDLKLSPEDTAKIETEAKNKMEQKLIEENVIQEAEKYAKLSVLEMYQPIIKKVSPAYSLEVVYKTE